MAQIRLNNVSSFKDRHGKTRWRFRKKGYPVVYLPGNPGSTEFMTAYELALQGKQIESQIGRDRIIPGSLDVLINRYLRSTEFHGLAQSTQKTYRRIFENFRERKGRGGARYGNLPVKGMKRHHIKGIIAEMHETPGAADSLLRRLKTLMRFALDEGMIEHDPTLRLKGYNKRTDGFRVWTENEISQFKAAYPVGSKERLALALLLCTAARGSDVARLGWQHIKDGKITIRAKKTNHTVVLPIMSELQIELNSASTDHLTFLVTEYGRPFSIKGFQQWFAKRARIAGLEPKLGADGQVRGCTAHGLRKSAATRLANAGCDDRLIMAVTGHKTVKEVTMYTRARDQELEAEQALLKVQKFKRDG